MFLLNRMKADCKYRSTNKSDDKHVLSYNQLGCLYSFFPGYVPFPKLKKYVWADILYVKNVRVFDQECLKK
jgi:hypothetical protein